MRHIKRPSQSFSHSVLRLGAVNKKSIGNMQALGLFSRRAILGRSNKSSVVLEKIAKENSLNRIGAVNFNKYGKQDGIGFLPCSDKFVDSFLLYVYVPDYFVRQGRPTRKLVWSACAFGHCLNDMVYRNVKSKSYHP